MRLILLVLLGTTCLSASAQWYRIDLKLKKHERFAPIPQVSDHSIQRLQAAALTKSKIHSYKLDRSDYSYEAVEADIMKTAQHNMRFRIYADASYNFSELARLYVHQNRFSEAKWFLLQSNIISRLQNDDKHTVANLMDLAAIKASIGDYELAQQDLSEAHDIALTKGYRNELKEIEKQIKYIKENKESMPRPELRYAKTAQNNGKAE